ncbi:MAG: LysM peptidoglycan-binding domain-containing protein [Opitutaceae bacterium]|nr:LysM peptidoglycan-binding domain-containing protein [Opitutaceae bacterium]
MWIRILLTMTLLAAVARGQGNSIQYEMANLREDMRGLVQRVGELTMRVEQLERENAALRSGAENAAQAYVTVAQLNDAVADLNRIVKASKGDIMKEVNQKLTALAKQTNAAVESVAKGVAQRATVQTTFSDNYSQEGTSYTVQKGDTISSIAQKTGARTQDIINANKIGDPSRLQVGQTLFIPSAK